jgi:hypothetical protein
MTAAAFKSHRSNNGLNPQLELRIQLKLEDQFIKIWMIPLLEEEIEFSLI